MSKLKDSLDPRFWLAITSDDKLEPRLDRLRLFYSRLGDGWKQITNQLAKLAKKHRPHKKRIMQVITCITNAFAARREIPSDKASDVESVLSEFTDFGVRDVNRLARKPLLRRLLG